MRPYSTTTPSSGRPSGYRFNFLQNVGGHTVQHHGKIASSFGQPLGSPFGPFQDSAGNAARPYYTTASSSGRLSSSLFGPVQDAGRHAAQHHGETASSSSRPSGSSSKVLQASADHNHNSLFGAENLNFQSLARYPRALAHAHVAHGLPELRSLKNMVTWLHEHRDGKCASDSKGLCGTAEEWRRSSF